MTSQKSERIETTIPAALVEVIDIRRAQLGMSRSGYLREMASADCVRAGLWPPVPVVEQSAGGGEG